MDDDIINILENDKSDELINLLNNGLDANKKIILNNNHYEMLKNKPPILCCAAFLHSEKCFNTLIEAGANINCYDFYRTPISHFAVVGNSKDILNKIQSHQCSFYGALFSLIEYSPSDKLMGTVSTDDSAYWLFSNHYINYREVDTRGYSLLKVAVEFQNLRILRFLIEEVKCLPIYFPDDALLFFAYQRKSNRCLKFLLNLDSKVIDINQTNEEGNTFLHIAGKFNHLNLVKDILSNFQNIKFNIQNKDGKTVQNITTNENILKLIEKKMEEIKSQCDKNANNNSQEAISQDSVNPNDKDDLKIIVKPTGVSAPSSSLGKRIDNKSQVCLLI